MPQAWNKPWLIPWIREVLNRKVGGEPALTKSERLIAIAMAILADDDGNLINYTWREVGELADMNWETVRRVMRNTHMEGLIYRIDERNGYKLTSPEWKIDWESLDE